MNYRNYKSCIDTCLNCIAACNYCASSCTREENVGMMAACIRLDLECAAICLAAVQMMSLGSVKAREICLICAEICTRCAEECEKHDNEHCRLCAHACRSCAEQCRKML